MQRDALAMLGRGDLLERARLTPWLPPQRGYPRLRRNGRFARLCPEFISSWQTSRRRTRSEGVRHQLVRVGVPAIGYSRHHLATLGRCDRCAVEWWISRLSENPGFANCRIVIDRESD